MNEHGSSRRWTRPEGKRDLAALRGQQLNLAQAGKVAESARIADQVLELRHRLHEPTWDSPGHV